MNPRRELAFLLGAGAMKDAGLPTAVELTQRVEERLKNEVSWLLPLFRFVSGAIQFGKGCRGEQVPAAINIEELLTALTVLAARDRLTVYPFVSAWHERIASLYALPEGAPPDAAVNSFEYLAKISAQNLNQWLRLEGNARIKYLRGFLDFLKRGFRLRIFTLNYDDGIERVLSDILGPPNDKWTNGFNERGWNPELLSADHFEAYVYKLHGSLDWFDDPKLGLCSAAWPAAEDSDGIPAEQPPLLIFGTSDKVRPVDPFLSLLFHFQQQLIGSGVLVVIGYGFGDEHVNAMLLDALQRDAQMRCLVVNPTPLSQLIPAESRLHRLLAVEERFVHLEMGAKQGFESDEILQTVLALFERREEEVPF